MLLAVGSLVLSIFPVAVEDSVVVVDGEEDILANVVVVGRLGVAVSLFVDGFNKVGPLVVDGFNVVV